MNKEDFFKNKDNIIAIIGIIFFLILAIMIRFNGNNEPLQSTPTTSPTPSASNHSTENNSSSEERKIFENILEENYHFVYTVTQNNQTEIIDGKKNHSKTRFSILTTTKEEYAKISDNYLKLENGSYNLIKEEIRPYLSYIEIEELISILETSLADEEDDIITYEIDTTDLLDRYTEIEYDGFEDFKDDQITLFLNKKGQVEKIELDYSNFFSYTSEQSNTFKVTMEFDQFGDIEDLEI